MPSRVTRSILVHLAREREKDHQVHETFVSSAVETIFRETALLTPHHTKATARKANRASHGPRRLATERAKKVREVENLSEKPKGPRVPKEQGKNSKTGLSGLETWKPETKLVNRVNCTDVSH